MIKEYMTGRYLWPWALSVPFLLMGFVCSVFFVGTDSPMLAPAVVFLSAFFVLALYPGFREGWAVPRSATFVFIMLFWLWLFISMFLSSIPYVSTTFTIILSILPSLFAASVMARDAGKWTAVHAGALWLAMAGFALWALIQFFFLFDKMGPRIHHPFLDPNSMAGLLNLAIAPAIAMFMLAKKGRYILLASLMLLVLYGGLVVTQSRAGFVSCLIASLVFLSFCVWRNPEGFPWKRLLFVLALAVLVPLLGNVQEPLENLVRPTVQETFMEARSLEDRFYLWESTAKMIKDHFWLGTGLATFYFYYPRYRLPLDRSDGFFAHMDPLQFWAETGVLAPVLFYAILICVLIRTIKSVKAAGGDMRKRLEIAAPFCGMLALTGHAHLNYHLYMPGMLVPLSAMLAFWYMATERALGDSVQRKIWKPEGVQRYAVLALLLVAVSFPSIWIARVSAATKMLQLVQKETNEGNKAKADRLLSLASIVSPDSYGRYYEYEARILLGRLWDKSSPLNVEETKRIFERAMYFLDEAEKRNPAFTTIQDLRARLFYTVNGVVINDGYERATALFEKIIEENPLASDSRVALANIYKGKGDLQKAAYVLEKGVQWPRPKGRPDIVFLLTLANLKLQLGDKAAHDLYMEIAKAHALSYGMAIQ